MKYSIYNSLLRITDNSSILYNAMSDKFIILSNQAEKDYQLCNLDILKDKNPILYNQLIETESIVDENTDEVQEVKNRINNKILDDKTYHLHINPTLDCNFRCWYCYEKHQVGSRMNYDVITAVKEHIKLIISTKPNLEFFFLSFFGGEPLMYFKSIAQPIIEFLEKECNENNIGFKIHFTSNSFLLNGHILHFFKNKNVSFQITLDGEKKFHDKVKFTKGCESTFEHVLKNINNILSLNPDIRVFLRINYTHKTLTPQMVDEVNEFIEYNNRECITVTPKKVWQENTDKNFTSTIQQIIDLFDASGYKVSRWDIPSGSIPCYVSKEYYNAINFNGNVVKCTACNDLYERQAKGVLKDNGIIEWNDSYDIKCQSRTFENERCLDCKKLPVCVGICPRDHILGKTHCKYDVIDSDFEKDLINYLVHQYY